MIYDKILWCPLKYIVNQFHLLSRWIQRSLHNKSKILEKCYMNTFYSYILLYISCIRDRLVCSSHNHTLSFICVRSRLSCVRILCGCKECIATWRSDSRFYDLWWGWTHWLWSTIVQSYENFCPWCMSPLTRAMELHQMDFYTPTII